MRRLLITGAAGGLGSICRRRLGHLADTLRLSDVVDLGTTGPNEEIKTCNLADAGAVSAHVEGCDGIVHLGGCPNEASWQTIRAANIDGLVDLYEAARRHGRPRIAFASSNHAIGYYRQSQRIDAAAPARPDGLYGVSKVFGEAIASMYNDKFGIETASIRIGSCLPEPADRRMMALWLSYGDFVALIERDFGVPALGCPIIYGASDDDISWWGNSKTAYLDWRPQDNSEAFRSEVDAFVPPGPNAPDAIYQGGMFTANGIIED